jgi:hypothetical protein
MHNEVSIVTLITFVLFSTLSYDFFNSPKLKKITIKPYTNGYTHISLTVKNIQSIYKVLKKKKIIFNSFPKESANGKVCMTYCKTPEGAFLELVEEL